MWSAINNMFPPLISEANRNTIDRIGDVKNHVTNDSGTTSNEMISKSPPQPALARQLDRANASSRRRW